LISNTTLNFLEGEIEKDISLQGYPDGNYFWQISFQSGPIHCGRLVKAKT
jgi:hypothetical protein